MLEPPPITHAVSSDTVASAAADASRVRQALESLRLDVEAVFDRHRDLQQTPPLPDRVPELLFHPVGIQPSDTERLPIPARHARKSRVSISEAPEYLMPAGMPGSMPSMLETPRQSLRPSQQSQRKSNRASLASMSSAGAMRRLKRERTSFLKESDTNWMHSLVEEPRRSTQLQRAMSQRLSDVRNRFIFRRGSQDFVPKLVRRTEFELARAVMMILDAVLVVCEMQDAANRASSSFHSSPGGISDRLVFTVLLDVSCGLFLFDLCLRFLAGRFDPSAGVGLGWQTFHVVVVIAQLLQAIGQHSHRHQRSHSQYRVVLTMLSTLRLVRVLSLVILTDVIRQHRFFRELRIMVLSLTGAVKAMVWASLLAFMFLLIFGAVLSEGTLAFLTRNGPSEAGRVDESLVPLWEHFGSLFDAVLTLFQVISGGVDWEFVWANLGTLGWGFRGLLLFFIGFSLIALMNVVTAVMLESTQLRCKADRGLVVQSEIIEKMDYLNTMRNIFEELDEEKTGQIDQETLRRRMQEPEIGAYFSQLGVDSEQVGKLFHLLDTNKTGTIDSEEFMFGCLKFRGEAKRVDVAVLHRELIWIHDELEILAKQLDPRGHQTRTSPFGDDMLHVHKHRTSSSGSMEERSP